jgi:hypothetical protein
MRNPQPVPITYRTSLRGESSKIWRWYSSGYVDPLPALSTICNLLIIPFGCLSGDPMMTVNFPTRAMWV